MMKRFQCHTPGCVNNGIEYLWDYDTALALLQAAGDDAAQQVTLAPPTCGGCSQPVTDIVDDGGVKSSETGGIAPASDGGS